MITALERRKHNICKHADRAIKEIDAVIVRLTKAHYLAHGGEIPFIISQAIQDLRDVKSKVIVISNHHKES